MARRVQLLFAHGGSFCKQVWAPITRRLQAMPAMQRVHAECVTFDMPFHGERRDVSQRPVLHLENAAKPRVSHPAMQWTAWGPEEVARQVALLQAKTDDDGGEKIPLIGIGHSLGAASLWAIEMENPGTFDGLILFEPMTDWNGHPYHEKAMDFLVGLTLQRRAAWYVESGSGNQSHCANSVCCQRPGILLKKLEQTSRRPRATRVGIQNRCKRTSRALSSRATRTTTSSMRMRSTY
ncbi:hypothetical protein PINS_up001217 [Pythium insidiosum]|nr:hypothetical protein PINS_up001217 [Pythium insidiosum]